VLYYVLDEKNREVERAMVMKIEREREREVFDPTKSTTKRDICGGFATSTHLLAPHLVHCFIIS
jgi:hypothetical protein